MAETCRCSHARGDHAPSGAAFPHAQEFGVCYVPDCNCREFADDVRASDLDAYAEEMTEQARNALDPDEAHELAEEALYARAAAARLRVSR